MAADEPLRVRNVEMARQRQGGAAALRIDLQRHPPRPVAPPERDRLRRAADLNRQLYALRRRGKSVSAGESHSRYYAAAAG